MVNLTDIDNKKSAHKKKKIYIPIWLKLAVMFALIIVIIVSLLSLVIFSRQRDQLYDQTVKIGMVSLNYFANSAPVPLLEENILSLNNLLKESTSVEGILYAFIINSEGIFQAHSNLNEIGKVHEPILRRQDLTHKNGVTYFNYHSPSGKKVLNLIQPVEYRNKQLGEVHVGISIDFIEDVISLEKKKLFEMSFIFLFGGILVAIVMGIYFSEPISTLVDATREIVQGNFGHQVRFRRKDELGDLAEAFNHMSSDLKKKSLMKESFGKYVGEEILEMILKASDTNWIKGQKKEASIILADIRGFTAYSENAEPNKVVQELNEFFRIATEIILEHNGYVDKFIGDAVLGVFGVPVYHSDHEELALKACLKMQEIFKKTEQEKTEQKKKGEKKEANQLLNLVGISINAGVVVSGNIGSQAKMEYTVIGDAVNLASRINRLAKAGEIIIGQTIFEKLRHRLETIALPPVAIKGKSEPVRTYKVLSFHENQEK
jgi:adenylate cyclase